MAFSKSCPGLVVMEGDSCSEGRGFESRNCVLDGHFFTYICCKNCNDVCLKRSKNIKEAGVGPLLTKVLPLFSIHLLNSVTRLGEFLKFWAKIFVTKVAQIFNDILSYFDA